MSDMAAQVRAIYAAFGVGDLDGILVHLSPDVEWEPDWSGPRLPFYRQRRGPAEVAQFFESLAVLEVTRFEVLNLLSGDRQVAAVVRFEARVRETGAVHSDLEIHLWTFGADGLVTRLRHFVDTWSLAIALGLTPPPSPAG